MKNCFGRFPLILAYLFLLWSAPQTAKAQLSWDFTNQVYQSKRGETNAHFLFHPTNLTSVPITVTALRPSCHCTAVNSAPLPWQIQPKESGEIKVDVDITERWGAVNKTIAVETSLGTNFLEVHVQTPEPTPREKNQLAAFADRQAVFKSDCATCHLQPAQGKSGQALYEAICAICHEAPNRAQMVPDLAALPRVRNEAYWTQWIRMGKPGTFMPAFSKPYGGPLTDVQIASLISYLGTRFSSEGASQAHSVSTPAQPPASR